MWVGMFANDAYFVNLSRLNLGREMGFDPGKILAMFGLGAPIPRGKGSLRVGRKVHLSATARAITSWN